MVIVRCEREGEVEDGSGRKAERRMKVRSERGDLSSRSAVVSGNG
jgi:hypothetical protein